MSLPHTKANSILDVLTRNAASLAQPAALYAALFSTAPTKATPGVEFTTTVAEGYTRCPLAFGVAVNSVAITSVVCGFPHSEGTPIDLSGAVSPWPQALALGIFDAINGGTLWQFHPLPTKPIVSNGFHITIPAGALSLTLDA